MHFVPPKHTPRPPMTRREVWFGWLCLLGFIAALVAGATGYIYSACILTIMAVVLLVKATRMSDTSRFNDSPHIPFILWMNHAAKTPPPDDPKSP